MKEEQHIKQINKKLYNYRTLYHGIQHIIKMNERLTSVS